MKNNLFIKIICLIIAALMIMPVLPENNAYAATINNDYVTVTTSNNPGLFGRRHLKVEVYLNGGWVRTDTISGFNGPGAGTVTVSPKTGYRVTSMEKNTSAGGGSYTQFTNGETLNIDSPPILGSRTRTLRIYLVTPPKTLNVNYYYDNVLQPEESTSEIKPIGEQINLELKVIEGKVFQRAIINDDSIERSIDPVTKEISFVMPNREVTLNYYYGTEGQVLLKKTAEPIPDKTNEFYIDLSVEGTAIVTRKAADIVLVFDRSASMRYELGSDNAGSPSRMDVLKEAANRFINSVIPANEVSLNQVSIVTYWGEADTYSWLKGWSGEKWNDAEVLQPFTPNNTAAKNSYVDLGPESGNKGGTNMQAGFRQVNDAFSTANGAREGVERYVIFMTDGDPTFYYTPEGYTDGIGTGFDSDAVTPTINEAESLKNRTGAKIYTVALISEDTNAQKVLNPKYISGNNRYQEENGYFHATTADQLTDVYSLLAAKISDEIANNAVVTDTLPQGFTFDTTNLPDGVTIDEYGKLKWELGTVNTVEKKIRVATKYTGDSYGIAFANESCGIEYVHKNTPDEVSTKTFEVPLGVLSPVVELPKQNVPYGYEMVIDPIPSAYDSSKLNVGADKGYIVSDLEVSIHTAPNHGTVVLNSDGTFTYTPNEGYEGPDSFKYEVKMLITNITPGYDPDGLVGTYVTVTTVIIEVEKRPTYMLTIQYDLYGIEMTDLRYIAELVPGQSYNVPSPEVKGWTAQTKTVTGTMPMHDVNIWVTYTKNESKLLQHRMYPNRGLSYSLMGDAKENYKIVSGIDYTFGFEFEAGQNNPVFSLDRSNISGTYTLDKFRLYDGEGKLISSNDTLDGLDGSLIKLGEKYTVTYVLRFTNNSTGKISLEVNFDYMDEILPTGVSKKLNIESAPMYLLQ